MNERGWLWNGMESGRLKEELMSRTYHCDTKEGLFAMVKDHIGFVGPMTVAMSK